MNLIEIRVRDIRSIWRGARASTDMMNGTGALVIRTPHTNIEIAGTPAELAQLKSDLVVALEAKAW